MLIATGKTAPLAAIRDITAEVPFSYTPTVSRTRINDFAVRANPVVDQDGNKATVFAPGSVGIINDPTEGLCMWYQCKFSLCQSQESLVNKDADQDNTADPPNLRFGYNYLSFDGDGWPILTEQR